MTTILFLHGWHSVPGGVKPIYLKDHGHEVINPALDDDDFSAAVATAQAASSPGSEAVRGKSLLVHSQGAFSLGFQPVT